MHTLLRVQLCPLFFFFFKKNVVCLYSTFLKAPSKPREASWASSALQFEFRFANDTDGRAHFELLGSAASSMESLRRDGLG